jgi:hypothetical protein
MLGMEKGVGLFEAAVNSGTGPLFVFFASRLTRLSQKDKTKL